jgi:uncharacterized protein with ATP-grasp and redox domains
VTIKPECLTCIFNQALRVTKELGLDEKKTKEVLDASVRMIPSFSYSLTPPQNATPMYEMISKMLDKEDLYYESKHASIQKAKSFIPLCEKLIDESQDQFLTATKIAVAGNVIDLASEVMFDLDEEIYKVMHTEFALDDTKALFKQLKETKTLVYLADNAGENVFDMLYIKFIKQKFKDIKIYYFVRGNPIINDITKKDIENDEIHNYANVVNSGVRTPGIVIEDMNDDARKIFDSAECIISKGMGNYECLSEKCNILIYFLLKVKCNVVASSLNRKIGDIICTKAIA